jgi:hypothetical protein
MSAIHQTRMHTPCVDMVCSEPDWVGEYGKTKITVPASFPPSRATPAP